MIFIGRNNGPILEEPPRKKARCPLPAIQFQFQMLGQVLARAKEVSYVTCNQQLNVPIAKLPFDILSLILNDRGLSYSDRLAFSSTCKRFLMFRVSNSNDMLMEIFTHMIDKGIAGSLYAPILDNAQVRL